MTVNVKATYTSTLKPHTLTITGYDEQKGTIIVSIEYPYAQPNGQAVKPVGSYNFYDSREVTGIIIDVFRDIWKFTAPYKNGHPDFSHLSGGRSMYTGTLTEKLEYEKLM